MLTRRRLLLSTCLGLSAGIAVAALRRPVARHVRALRGADPELLVPLAFLPVVYGRRTAEFANRRTPARALGPGIELERRTAPGAGGLPAVALEIYRSQGRPSPAPALVWIHGGGMVLGAPAHGDGYCSRVVAETGAVVISVDYRLAPQHPYPAAIDDCFSALSWVLEHAEEVGVDPTRVAIGGDSAGGGLAAALAQRAHDAGLPVVFQLLIYPMLDDRTVTRAERLEEWALMWNPPSNRYGWTSYLGRDPGGTETGEYAVPARRQDLSGLPPAWIGVGDVDLFHAEDVDYARRLQEAGVDCELMVQPGMYHGADQLVPGHPVTLAFTTTSLQALRRALTGTAPSPHLR